MLEESLIMNRGIKSILSGCDVIMRRNYMKILLLDCREVYIFVS